MKGIFNLKYKSGPHGDECTTYDLIIKEGTTLNNFVNGVIENKDEWGSIFCLVPNPETYNLPYVAEHERYKNIEIVYRYGDITDIIVKELYNKYKDYIIDLNYNNWANGGWSCMNCWIKIKE